MITEKHLKELLGAENRDARLVMVEGEALVVDKASGERSGALELLSRGDLEARLGTDEPSEAKLHDVASALDAVAANRGA